MKSMLVSLLVLLSFKFSFGQVKKVELYDLIKKFVQDSSANGDFGDWAIGRPAKYPVKWEADRIEMSDDEKINFFRKGTANITVNGNIIENDNKNSGWKVMLMGARAGFSSFKITSQAAANFHPEITLDSLLGKKQYSYKLVQSCDGDAMSGFYYYQLKIPGKSAGWIKLSWGCKGNACFVNLDCYDDWSKQYANLACPKN